MEASDELVRGALQTVGFALSTLASLLGQLGPDQKRDLIEGLTQTREQIDSLSTSAATSASSSSSFPAAALLRVESYRRVEATPLDERILNGREESLSRRSSVSSNRRSSMNRNSSLSALQSLGERLTNFAASPQQGARVSPVSLATASNNNIEDEERPPRFWGSRSSLRSVKDDDTETAAKESSDDTTSRRSSLGLGGRKLSSPRRPSRSPGGSFDDEGAATTPEKASLRPPSPVPAAVPPSDTEEKEEDDLVSPIRSSRCVRGDEDDAGELALTRLEKGGDATLGDEEQTGPPEDQSSTAVTLLLVSAHLYVMVMSPMYAGFDVRRRSLGQVAADVLVEFFCVWALQRRANLQRARSAWLAQHRKKQEAPPSSMLEWPSHLPVWSLEAIGRLVLTSPSQRRVLVVSRCFKLLLALRLVQRNVTEVGSSSNNNNSALFDLFGLDPGYYRICKLVLLFLTLLHYMACCYHVIVRASSSEADRSILASGWAYYGLPRACSQDPASYSRCTRKSLFSQWVNAYYFAVMTILGNYNYPTRGPQVAFTMALALFGLAFIMTISASITSMLANADVTVTKRREKLESMRVYFRENGVARELAETIEGFYQYLWVNEHDDHTFDDLSASLKLKLHLATKRRFIVSCSLFGDVVDQRVIVRLVLGLRLQILVPEEIAVAQGEVGQIMYFVSRGVLNVTVFVPKTKSTINVARITDGDYFGESAILENGFRNATVRAETFTELLYLTRQAFRDALSSSNENLYNTILLNTRRRKVVATLSEKLRRVRTKFRVFAAFLTIMLENRYRKDPDLLAKHQARFQYYRGGEGSTASTASSSRRSERQRSESRRASMITSMLPSVHRRSQGLDASSHHRRSQQGGDVSNHRKTLLRMSQQQSKSGIRATLRVGPAARPNLTHATSRPNLLANNSPPQE